MLLLFGGHVASNHKRSSHARWNRFVAKWKKLLRNCMRVCEWERTKARLLFLSFIIFYTSLKVKYYVNNVDFRTYMVMGYVHTTKVFHHINIHANNAR